MDPKPFTYEHFIQAVQSMKDDMLMYYIDEAVAIYCRIKGKSVGPRPASSKDYLQEYADAFEAANYAIFVITNKIGAYNTDKGAFRPYRGKALESALRVIFMVDGYETLSGSSKIKNEPDTSASDAEERVRQHKDDAFETMIKFIDALPEIKRAAIYTSAFGQILRPDLGGWEKLCRYPGRHLPHDGAVHPSAGNRRKESGPGRSSKAGFQREFHERSLYGNAAGPESSQGYQ